MSAHKGIIDIRQLKLLLGLLFMRLLYLCVVKAYFVPDEYWQSLEIAHRTVFGYGYMTWEWHKGIRSFFYPFWFSLCYKVLEICKLDYVDLLILFPRILQSILSAIADLYLWLWLNNSELKLKKSQIYWVYVMWTMCMFVNYCSSRTLTNTAEMNFSIIAMYYFPWRYKRVSSRIHFLWFVGFSCLVRPTAVIQWLPLCVFDILSNPKPFKYLLTTYLCILSKILSLSIIIDLLFYKKIILTPLNFIIYNGQYNVGIHYGIHSWFWYIFVGIPVVLGPVFILLYMSLFRNIINIGRTFYKQCFNREIYYKKPSVECLCVFTLLWTIFWYSVVPHKEFRFILPLAPVMMYLAGIAVDFNFSKKSNFFVRKYMLITISVSAIIVNVIGLIYLGQWHQIGSITVMSKLARVAHDNPEKTNLLFLTPCHAHPFYSHLHVNVTARFLTCEPNLSSRAFYKDEADLFFENPLRWLNENVSGDICNLPSHIIFFSNLKLSIEEFLNNYNYKGFDVIFNSHITQGRQSQYIEVYNVIKPETC